MAMLAGTNCQNTLYSVQVFSLKCQSHKGGCLLPTMSASCPKPLVVSCVRDGQRYIMIVLLGNRQNAHTHSHRQRIVGFTHQYPYILTLIYKSVWCSKQYIKYRSNCMVAASWKEHSWCTASFTVREALTRPERLPLFMISYGSNVKHLPEDRWLLQLWPWDKHSNSIRSFSSPPSCLLHVHPIFQSYKQNTNHEIWGDAPPCFGGPM